MRKVRVCLVDFVSWAKDVFFLYSLFTLYSILVLVFLRWCALAMSSSKQCPIKKKKVTLLRTRLLCLIKAGFCVIEVFRKKKNHFSISLINSELMLLKVAVDNVTL